MDEADKLCDRIAIVDHGKLVALDSPLKLKASVPGKNILEVSFSGAPANWTGNLESAAGRRRSESRGKRFPHLLQQRPAHDRGVDGSGARRPTSTVTSLSVQSTTLDDVFVHYTGHQLRDTLQAPSAAESPFIMKRD